MFQEPTIEARSKEAEIDKSPTKIALLAVFGVAMSALTTFTFLRLLSAINASNLLLWLGAVLLFFSLAILQVFFVKRASKLMAICAVEVLAASAFFIPQFYPFPSIPLIVGIALFAVLFMVGSYDGWKFVSESLSVRFSFVTRNFLSRALLGFLLFSSAVLYVSYFELGRFNPEDGKILLTSSVISIEPALKVAFPGSSLNESVNQFFRRAAEAELRKIPKTKVPEGLSRDERVDFQILTKQQQERAITEAAGVLHATFEKAIGSLPKDALLKDALFSVIAERIDAFSEKTKSYFGILVALLFFSLGKAFFAVFGVVIRSIAFLFYKLLFVLGFAYMSVETRNREFIMLS